MAILNKDALLQRAKVVEVVLEGGDTTCIRPLPAGVVYGGGGAADESFAARCVFFSLCDKSGKPLFGEDEPTSAALNLSLADFNAIYREVATLNGFARRDDEGETEAAEKN